MLRLFLVILHSLFVAHIDPFIFLPIVLWVFISFWFIYLLMTGMLLPRLFTAYRARVLISVYLSKNFYTQILSIMGFYLVFVKVTSKFYLLALDLFRSYRMLLKLRTFQSLAKIRYFNKVLLKMFKYI